MKKFIYFLFLLFVSSKLCYSKEFVTQPIHQDNYFVKLPIPMESELFNLFKDKNTELNIILNYLKTIDFCDGVVSDIIYDRYSKTLASLPEDLSSKVRAIERELLEKKKISLFIVNIRQSEHFLPIKFLDNYQ